MAILLLEHYLKRSLSWKVLWYILGAALFVSCFLAWRDEHNNAEILKDQKSALTSERNVLQAKLEGKQDQIEQIISQRAPTGTDQHIEQAHRSAQARIGRFIDAGNALSKQMTPGISVPQYGQQKWSLSVHAWHNSVEAYLKTLPNGKIYLSSFRNKMLRGIYPAGPINTPEGYDAWDLLSSDLSKLEEFLQDKEFGNP